MTDVLSAMKDAWRMQGKIRGFPNELVFRNHITQDSTVSSKQMRQGDAPNLFGIVVNPLDKRSAGIKARLTEILIKD